MSKVKNQNLKDIILLGGGGHCKSVIDVIEFQNKYNIVGIVDKAEKLGEKILGYEIFATDDEIEKLSKSVNNFFITVGQIKSPDLRKKLFYIIQNLKVEIPVIISPDAYVSKHSKIGRGSIVMHNAIVNAGTEIGENCIINNKALIEHDVEIGNNCHISTAAVVNGGVKIGENTFFGSGAISKEYIKIAPNSFIKANSIVKF